MVEKAKSIIKTPGRYNKATSFGACAYINNLAYNNDDGTIIANDLSIDMNKIEEEEKYDGFYAVATNLDDSAKDILAVAQNRYKIEDCFRIMKTNFDARPVFLRKPERIRAHFLICYTALLIYRLMECKLDDNLTHVTTSNLIKTLRNMNVVNMDDMSKPAK